MPLSGLGRSMPEVREDASVQYIRKAAEKVPVFLINGQLKGGKIYIVYIVRTARRLLLPPLQLIEAGRKKICFLQIPIPTVLRERWKDMRRRLGAMDCL